MIRPNTDWYEINFVPRALALFDQRVSARRDSRRHFQGKRWVRVLERMFEIRAETSDCLIMAG